MRLTAVHRYWHIKDCLWVILAAIALIPINSFGLAIKEPQYQNAQKPASFSDAVQTAQKSAVMIVTSDAFGSGVLVDPSGVIITSLHVIQGQSKVTIKLANGDIYDDVGVIDFDERRDIAVLKLKAFGCPTAVLGNSDKVAVGNKVFLIGSPRGYESTVSDGIVSAIRDTGEGYRLIQTTAAASPGSSGGGMFNERGELVGVVCSKIEDGENLNFAVPINYVRGLVSTHVRFTLAELAMRSPSKADPDSHSSMLGNPEKPENVEADSSHMFKILEESGLKYSKDGENTWRVTYQGSQNDSVDVYIRQHENFAFILSEVLDKPKLNPEQMKKLLNLAYRANLSKIGISEEGSLLSMNETDLRLLNGQGLRDIADAVASLADDIVEIFEADLVTPATSTRHNSTSSNEPSSSVQHYRDLVAPPDSNNVASITLLDGHTYLHYPQSAWKIEDTGNKEIAQFNHISESLFIRVIHEEIEIPWDVLDNVILLQMKSFDKDAKIVREGWRNINGIRMRVLEVESTIEGIPFTYYCHVYTCPHGTVQIMAGIPTFLLNRYRDSIDTFASGFRASRK